MEVQQVKVSRGRSTPILWRLTKISLLFLILSCTAKDAVKMRGYKSEGLTTTIIEFYVDGTFKITESTFTSSTSLTGSYSFQDSVINLGEVDTNIRIKSGQLLLKHDSLINYSLLQLDAGGKVDSTFTIFDVTFPSSNEQ